MFYNQEPLSVLSIIFQAMEMAVHMQNFSKLNYLLTAERHGFRLLDDDVVATLTCVNLVYS